MIEIENLVKYYGEKKAVDNISFNVKEGEILGFLGPNGAGKTTTMNIITGYLSATSGRVRVDGHDILEEPQEVKKNIGFLPEQPPIYPEMTVIEFLQFVCDLKNVEHRIKKPHINEIMEVVQISHVSRRLIRNLSKGYKQRVGLAQAMIGNPKVLVLDEPTVGLDPAQIIEIRRLIRRLRKQHTVILSSHILPEIQAVSDRIAIISNGKIVANDTPESLTKSISDGENIILSFEGPLPLIVQRINEMQAVRRVSVQKEGKNGRVSIDVDPGKDIRKDIFHLMSVNQWAILEMRSRIVTLEDVFIQVTAPTDTLEV